MYILQKNLNALMWHFLFMICFIFQVNFQPFKIKESVYETGRRKNAPEFKNIPCSNIFSATI